MDTTNMIVTAICAAVVCGIVALLWKRGGVSEYFSPQPPIIHRLRKDIRHMQKEIHANPTFRSVDPDIAQLIRRLDADNIVAGGHTHTVSKMHVKICVSPDPNFSEEENYDTIVFTTIHELAHVMTPEWGHGENFWQNFDVLISIARRTGIFKGLVNFHEVTFKHCDHRINHNYLPAIEKLNTLY